MKRLFRGLVGLSIFLGLCLVAATLVPLWYWAIYGMSEPVGDAWIGTGFIILALLTLSWSAAAIVKMEMK